MANEKRLIDANALMEKIQFRLPITNDVNRIINKCVLTTRKAITEATTVDAVEVVHGKWEKQLGFDHCSVCHKIRPYDVQADVVEYWQCNYCPNCGAKMDGGN